LEPPPRIRVGTPEQLSERQGDTLYEVNVEEAREGLEWLGVESDMQYVIDATNLLVEMVGGAVVRILHQGDHWFEQIEQELGVQRVEPE
jgi:hypothetical protein